MKKNRFRILSIIGLSFILAIGFSAKVYAHSYLAESRLEPTCTKEGIIRYECEYCDLFYEETLLPLGHDYQGSNPVEATCTEKGHITYMCTRCQDTYTETQSPLEHNYQKSEQIEATCTEAGYVAYTCTRCQNTYKETQPALGHNYQESKRVKATYKAAGYVGYTCTQCKTSYTETIPILERHYKKTAQAGIQASKGAVRQTSKKAGNQTALQTDVQSNTQITTEAETGNVMEHIEADTSRDKEVDDRMDTPQAVAKKSVADISQINGVTILLAGLICMVCGGGGMYVFSYQGLFKWIEQQKKKAFQQMYGGN